MGAGARGEARGRRRGCEVALGVPREEAAVDLAEEDGSGRSFLAREEADGEHRGGGDPIWRQGAPME